MAVTFKNAVNFARDAAARFGSVWLKRSAIHIAVSVGALALALVGHALISHGFNYWILAAALPLFLLVSPILGVIVALQYAIYSVLYFFWQQSKDAAIGYFFEKFFEYAHKLPHYDAINTRADKALATVNDYLSRLSNMNWTMRLLIKALLSKINVVGLLDREMRAGEQKPTLELAAQNLVAKADTLFLSPFLEPSLRLFYLFIAGNAAFAALLVWLFQK